jgi:ATP-dependent DNA helicase RecG
MTRNEVQELISEVQERQSELDDLEVKSAREGTPGRSYESLSAFANQPGGGLMLFGLDEKQRFEVVGVKDAQRLQAEISHLAASEMEPALRPRFTVETFEGRTVVVVEVDGLPNDRKPCYYKPAGLQKGAYIRVANTNRVMTDYEIFGYVSARQQPVFDEAMVADATLDDLDAGALRGYVDRLRRERPKTARLPLIQVLGQRKVVRLVDGVARPTLAGLLMFGEDPQQFEPQLVITFLHFYGTTETERTPRGERFLDNRKFEGAIPEMVEAAVNHILASIRKSSLIEGLYRRDIPEYPEEAVREAVLNAVAHRDYSQFVRGSYVQIRLFADRLEIQSPGGLFGNVTEETIEDEQSTRNRVLMRLMEDTHLVENRGSGIDAMIAAMRQANLEPPRFQDKRSSFWVVFRNHTLMNPEAIAWLNQFAAEPINDRQRVALAYLRLNQQITNGEYQRLNRVDSVTANRELRGLVQTRLVTQNSTRRWAFYTLNVRAAGPESVTARPEPGQSDEAKILRWVQDKGFIKRADCQRLLGLSPVQARHRLQLMRKKGLLKMEGERKGSRYVLA